MNLKAPTRHGDWVCVHNSLSWREVIAGNQRISSSLPGELGVIRSAFLQEANLDDKPVVMAGHQPEWFHPGVWAKNFLADKIARICNGHSSHCVIDSDVPKSGWWKLPDIKSPGAIRIIPFMALKNGQIPWEFQPPPSPRDLDQSLEIVESMTKSWGSRALVSLCRNSLARTAKCANAGELFTMARKNVENNLNLSLRYFYASHFFAFKSFTLFLVKLFQEIRQASHHYNSSIESFRASHGIKSLGRPIPFLMKSDDWFETPLWVFSSQNPSRSRLWIRPGIHGLDLRSDDGRFKYHCPLEQSEDLFQFLQNIMAQGLRIRPRALLTSVWLRVFASDLFIHGIGGAIYDEMTDLWIRGWLGITPPTSVACTLTARLLSPHPQHATSEINLLKGFLRRATWHAETVVDQNDCTASFAKKAKEKRCLIAWEPTDPHGKKWRCLALRRINKLMADSIEGVARDARSIVDRESEWKAEETLLQSRELPWIVHPTDEIKTLMNNLTEGINS